MTQYTISAEIGDFPILGDHRGQLIAAEAGRNVPFPIKRVYYIFGTTEGVARGKHAHHDLDQIAVCVRGRCVMTLDNGADKIAVALDAPQRWVRIPPMIWHEMSDFSEDCVMIVFASDYYNEADYIRSYNAFLGLVGKGRT